MKLAIDLAKGVVGQTSLNPPVVAVIVKDSRVVGIGLHMQTGEKHTEVLAIEMAGDIAHGADLYVTLEPCSHYDKTPPCAHLILESDIRQVFISTIVPYALVAGKEMKLLKKHGICVEISLYQQEANALYFFQKRIPYITLKFAMTADGKLAVANGDNKWIASECSRHDTIN